MKDKTTIQEIIQFLIDNEQYGDNWNKHIDLLQKISTEIEEDEKS